MERVKEGGINILVPALTQMFILRNIFLLYSFFNL